MWSERTLRRTIDVSAIISREARLCVRFELIKHVVEDCSAVGSSKLPGAL